ncbi:MAG: hypothetical protein N4A47_04170 [Clostridia bacterium]|jgi:hypothetical protein|nr:hypothetical protein [Clostridia bacterium]
MSTGYKITLIIVIIVGFISGAIVKTNPELILTKENIANEVIERFSENRELAGYDDMEFVGIKNIDNEILEFEYKIDLKKEEIDIEALKGYIMTEEEYISYLNLSSEMENARKSGFGIRDCFKDIDENIIYEVGANND